MPNDAKLGLVVGVGLVVAITVVYFRKEPPAPAGQAPAGAVTPSRPAPVAARPPTQQVPVTVTGLRHTVREGETLFSLAQRYYKDGRKFVDIYRVNQESLPSPETPAPGTVLVIPGVPEPNPTAVDDART